MACHHTLSAEHVELKYKSNFLGTSVQKKMNGQWTDFCSNKGQKLKIMDKTAICSFPQGFTITSHLWNDDGLKAPKTTFKGMWLLDFSKVTFKENTKWQRYNATDKNFVQTTPGFKCKGVKQ